MSGSGSGSGSLSQNVRYSVPSSAEHTDSGHPPIMMNLPDGLLEQMLTAGRANKLSLNVSEGSSNTLSISLGSKIYPLNPDSSSSESDAGLLYQLNNSTSEIHRVGALPTSYLLDQPLKQDTTALATSRLKERRQEEALRKQNSRAVMLDQSQFDKRGKLTSSTRNSRPSTPMSNAALPLAASTGSGSGGDVVQLDSPNFKSSSLGLSLSPRPNNNMALSRSSSSTAIPLAGPSRSSSSTALPTVGTSLNRGRSNSPALNTLLNGTSTPTKAPSLRQRIFHLLASGAQSRNHILKTLSSYSEIPILRLLTLVADHDSDSEEYSLKPELYKEVASSIQSGTWPAEASTDEKNKIVDRAKEAFEKIKLSSKSPEWRALSKWVGDGEPSTTSKNKSTETVISRQRTVSNQNRSKSPEERQQPATSIESGKKRSTTRDRLTRAVKGKGPRGPELKKEQDRQKRRLEKEQQERDKEKDRQGSTDVQVDRVASSKKGDRAEHKAGLKGSRDQQQERQESIDIEVERIAKTKKGDVSTEDRTRGKGKGDKSSRSPERRVTQSTTEKMSGKGATHTIERLSHTSKEDTQPAKQPSTNKQSARNGTSTASDSAQRSKHQSSTTTSDRPSATETSKRLRDSGTAASTATSTSQKITTEQKASPAAERKRKRSQDSEQSGEQGEEISDGKVQRDVVPGVSRSAEASSSSSTATVKAKKCKSELPDTVPSPPSTNITSSLHHGPSASASLLNAEPWLDIRTTSEWRRLAERFKRVYDQYDEQCRLLENEKSKLTFERQIATTTPTTHTIVVRQPSMTRQQDEELEEGEEEGETFDDHPPRRRSSSLSPDPTSKKSSDTPSNQYSWRSAVESQQQKPLSMDQLRILVQDQISRQGELKRMKEVLIGYKSET
ncbi:unnamed protein product [Sympodiomycopsis kandeliae]